jgi:MinD-like ATPase involved in chromosome partitioning or flagellar assembly
VYPQAIVDGRPAQVSPFGRVLQAAEGLLVSRGEREEAEVEARLRSAPGVSRANTVAVVSPKGGVGKTTSTFLIGNLLAGHLKLRAVGVDANPDFGTLADLAPDRMRSARSLAELLRDADRVGAAAELGRYVSRLPTGLHLLGAPRDPDAMAALTPADYGALLDFLGRFYEVVLLDLGTGLTAPIARFALERADQLVLVTTPEWVTAQVVLAALEHVEHERTTLVVNKVSPRTPVDHAVIEDSFRERRLHRSIVIPHDDQLQTMLDSGTYALDGLARPTRLPVKRLALAVSEQLT